MTKYVIGCVLGFGMLASSSCHRGERVKVEIEDLRTGQVSESLEAQLTHARAEVLRLEQEVALARQGVTGEAEGERFSSAKAQSGSDLGEAQMTLCDLGALSSVGGRQGQVRTEAILPPTPIGSEERERATLERVNVSGRDEPRTRKQR